MMFKNKKKQSLEPLTAEEFMHEFLFESIKERRWRNLTRFIKAIALLIMVSVASYILLKGPTTSTNSVSTPHTALIKINGAIASQRTANADQVYKLLKRAFENQHAKAIILSINSPGGSPVQAGRIYDDVLRFKAVYDKPVYAYIDDLGASAGYYIALSADQIYANRASLVGSIGVISASFGLADVLNDLGVERRVFKSGDNKNFLDPFSPLNEEQSEFWQQQLNITHQQFIQRVLDSRGERLDVTEYGLFSGLIWNGEEAKRIGLIDDLSSPQQIAVERVDEPKVVEYRTRTNPISNLLNRTPFNFGSYDSNQIVETVLTEINTQGVKLQ